MPTGTASCIIGAGACIIAVGQAATEAANETAVQADAQPGAQRKPAAATASSAKREAATDPGKLPPARAEGGRSGARRRLSHMAGAAIIAKGG